MVYNQNSGSVNLILAQTKRGCRADRQQAVPPGAELRDGPQALDGDDPAGCRHAQELCRWCQTNPAYDAAKDQAIRVRPRQGQERCCSQSGISRSRSSRQSYSAASPDYPNVLQIWQAGPGQDRRDADAQTHRAGGLHRPVVQLEVPGSLIGGNSLFGQLHPAFFWGNAYYSPNANWASFKSDEYSQIADGLLKETDPAKQKQVYGQWMDYILDQSWALPWSNTVPRAATTAKVQGTDVQHDRVPHGQ